MGAGDPGPAGQAGVDGRAPGDFGEAGDAAVELGADDRAADEALAVLHLALGVQHRHARRAAGAAGRTVDLAGADHHRVGGGQHAIDALQRRVGEERAPAHLAAVKKHVSAAGSAQNAGVQAG